MTMMTLLRPALVASMLFGLLAGLSACGEGQAGTDGSDKKKRERRIYAAIETTIEGTGGGVAALAVPASAGLRAHPRG